MPRRGLGLEGIKHIRGRLKSGPADNELCQSIYQLTTHSGEAWSLAANDALIRELRTRQLMRAAAQLEELVYREGKPLCSGGAG